MVFMFAGIAAGFKGLFRAVRQARREAEQES
jgi:hypothetical protein